MIAPELLAALSSPSALSLPPPLPVDDRPRQICTFTPRTVHFSKDDPFFEDGDVHRHLYLEDMLTGIGEEEEKLKVPEFPCQTEGCSQVFDTLESYEHHYNTLHRNVCSTCKRSFPSARLLDIHILEWHDSMFEIMAEKNNMFQCLVEGCAEKFKTSGERKNHLIKTHLYPSDFRFDKPKKFKDKQKQDSHTEQDLSMDIAPDIAPDDMPAVESMEISEMLASDSTTSHTYSKSRVPSTICFGHGSVRGFKP